MTGSGADFHTGNETREPSPWRPSGRSGISEAPLINAIHRRAAEILFAAYSAVLIHLSFVPFDLSSAPTRPSGPQWRWGLRIAPVNIADILANLAIYLPFGALLCLVLCKRGIRRGISALTAPLLAAVLSLTIEYGQHWTRSRVPSWIDSTANVLGAGLGAMLACLLATSIRRLADRAWVEARQNWWLVVSHVFVCLLLLVELRPYDVVVDVFHTASATVRSALWHPLARWNALPVQIITDPHLATANLARLRWEYGLDRLADVAAYAAAAAVVTLAQRSGGASRRLRAFLAAGFVTVTLAAMVTGIRVLLISHGLDTAHFFCGLVGWPLGFTAAWALGATPGGAARSSGDRSSLRTSCRTWPLAALACMTMVFLYELVPFDLNIPGVGTSRFTGHVNVVPFLSHFHSRTNDALMDISGDLVHYAVLGAALAVLIQPLCARRWRTQLAACIGLPILISIAFQAMHVFMPSRHPDVTTVILAAAGAFFGVVAARWVSDVRRAVFPVVVDDLLTTQLVEGETYNPIEVKATGQQRADASRTDQARSD